MNKKIDNKQIATLANSDAFKVEGYFRFQKCGKNRLEKKLVWVNKKKAG